MSNIIEYNDYINSPYGSIIPPEEKRMKEILVRASSVVRTRIMNRDYSAHKEIVKNTTCLVANILYNQIKAKEKISKIVLENNISSEKIGNWTRNYNTSVNELKEIADDNNVKNEINTVIEENLLFTGLLYRGISNV